MAHSGLICHCFPSADIIIYQKDLEECDYSWRWAVFKKDQSEASMQCTRIPSLIWSASGHLGVLRGNRHCIHRVRFQHCSGATYVLKSGIRSK